ncbi:unnamed protein product [Wuchereria bancrofti]|uniref:Uncharacterized protein n=1 Tax=Wuchereria bancrofti TaxID=6293 RepID=A0A3P7EB69_WUCBA|nr:unnamed protein product [Wuchereria bancrofti]
MDHLRIKQLLRLRHIVLVNVRVRHENSVTKYIRKSEIG